MANTTISVSKQNRDRLRTFGIAGESYDEIVQRLMDNMDRDAFISDMRRRADQADLNATWINDQDADEFFQ